MQVPGIRRDAPGIPRTRRVREHRVQGSRDQLQGEEEADGVGRVRVRRAHGRTRGGCPDVLQVQVHGHLVRQEDGTRVIVRAGRRRRRVSSAVRRRLRSLRRRRKRDFRASRDSGSLPVAPRAEPHHARGGGEEV